jgi:hypothetical protein
MAEVGEAKCNADVVDDSAILLSVPEVQLLAFFNVQVSICYARDSEL